MLTIDTCRHCQARIAARVQDGGDYPGDNVAWLGPDGRAECDPDRTNQVHEPQPWRPDHAQ